MWKLMSIRRMFLLFFSVLVVALFVQARAQVKPQVTLVGGDDVPQLKKQIETTLETVLLEMNRLSKQTGDVEVLKRYFSQDAFRIFEQFVLQNRAYTVRKSYSPQMIQREKGQFYDIRSITVKVNLGQTEASENQNLVLTVSKDGIITSVRAVLPNYDYHSVVSAGKTAEDSLTRGRILDFLERFRMAYNTKDGGFLEKVYSDEALIIVGSVLQEKKNSDDMLRGSRLTESKVKLVQYTKREYLNALKNRAFKSSSFINVRFEEVEIQQHEKIPQIYGVACWQQWNSSGYSDKGFLFLMLDFRNPEEPVIHVRTWQPKSFEDGTYVSLYDFDVLDYK